MAPSNKPQNITDAAWYYENRGSIDLILDTKKLPRFESGMTRFIDADGFVHLRIPSRLLRKTIERQWGTK